MAARKGIKKKVVEVLAANPAQLFTGRELERMYVANGGSVYPDDHERRSIRGRVSRDTVQHFIDSLPITRVSEGPGSGYFKSHYERATFQADPVKIAQLNLQPAANP